jgi:nitroreductase
MNVKESVEMRKSIRAFKKEPVPREILREILQTALRAPSWGNTQPCLLTVVGGQALQSMIKSFLEKVSAGEPPGPEVEFPKEWPEALGRRYKENGKKLFEVLGIGREDREKRDQHRLNMFRFWGAPQAIYLHVDKRLGPYAILDTGLLTQTLALLAAERGVGTCFLAVSVLYPDVVRQHTGIPETDRIIMGMAIGYPDWDAPVNQFRSEREPFGNLVRWVD